MPVKEGVVGLHLAGLQGPKKLRLNAKGRTSNGSVSEARSSSACSQFRHGRYQLQHIPKVGIGLPLNAVHGPNFQKLHVVEIKRPKVSLARRQAEPIS